MCFLGGSLAVGALSSEGGRLGKKGAEEAAASRKRKQPTEAEILRTRRKELGIPDDDPKLVAALFEEHGITPEEITYSARVAHFGPTIMNAERLWRALRLNLTTVAAIKGKDWNYNPSDPPLEDREEALVSVSGEARAFGVGLIGPESVGAPAISRTAPLFPRTNS